MDVKKSHVASLLLLVIILASQEILSQGQVLQCERRSGEFRGFCRTTKCRAACQGEGFENGYCHFRWIFPLNRKCMCQIACTAAPGPKEDDPEVPLDFTNLRMTDLGR